MDDIEITIRRRKMQQRLRAVGLNQRKFAERYGYDEGTLSYWLHQPAIRADILRDLISATEETGR